METTVVERFTYPQYTVRKKVFKLFGGAFHVYGPNGQVVLYSKMKAFKLKEDIRLYTGEDMRTEVLTIRARSIIDFSSAYDVVDPATQRKVGALRRKGLKSLVRDEWLILDDQDREVGLIQEDSTGLALLRRFIEIANWFIPQKYHVQVAGRHVASFQRNINPFVLKVGVDFALDPQGLLDRRLGLAAAILMAAIEGRQQE